VAAAALGGKIYAVGGSATPAGPGGPGGGPGALASVEAYSPETDEWELLASATNVGRTTHAVVPLASACAPDALLLYGGLHGGLYARLDRGASLRRPAPTACCTRSAGRTAARAGLCPIVTFQYSSTTSY
jgi:hypothetical protein